MATPSSKNSPTPITLTVTYQEATKPKHDQEKYPHQNDNTPDDSPPGLLITACDPDALKKPFLRLIIPSGNLFYNEYTRRHPGNEQLQHIFSGAATTDKKIKK